MEIINQCEYNGCTNIATGQCAGKQHCICISVSDDHYAFAGDCNKSFCQDHLKWGWGLYCINCCIASPQCPKHHTGIYCCIIL